MRLLSKSTHVDMGFFNRIRPDPGLPFSLTIIYFIDWKTMCIYIFALCVILQLFFNGTDEKWIYECAKRWPGQSWQGEC